MNAVMIEAEFNYHLSDRWSSGVSLGHGRSVNGLFEETVFSRLGLHVNYLPFRVKENSQFRLGAGVVFNTVEDTYDPERVFVGTEPDRQSVGIQLSAEQLWRVSDRSMIGLKGIVQPQFNGDLYVALLARVSYALSK